MKTLVSGEKVVIFLDSTSNHNAKEIVEMFDLVVIFLDSTSNHNLYMTKF